jgi:uroporphyrin-III C-methyltransferase/precorrin-2 dehydrogenase/sirohydrochlorin ferrochelatase
MGAGLAETISVELIRRGKSGSTPVVLVEKATLAERRVLGGRLADLPELASKAGNGPALLLLGEVLKDAIARADSMADIEAFLKRA